MQPSDPMQIITSIASSVSQGANKGLAKDVSAESLPATKKAHGKSSPKSDEDADRRTLPDSTVILLKTWLFEHQDNPYPTTSEKVMRMHCIVFVWG